MTQHKMFDFETLDTKPAAVVLSLGVTKFDSMGISDKRLWSFNLDDQLIWGRTISASTLSWWMSQGTEAKAVFDAAVKSKTKLTDFCNEYKEWAKDDVDYLVWGNGATFDITIVENIFLSQFGAFPWKYSNVRCYRTIKSMFRIEDGKDFKGTRHNALDDSIFQSENLIEFLQKNPGMTDEPARTRRYLFIGGCRRYSA